MIKCKDFYELCKKYELTFFSGVPDSTFKSWMSFLDKNKKNLTNIPTVNECEAVAICAGYHLATGKIGVLYMQNSGFGKTINPITSLCDPKVYSIPLLLMIGWRGEPGEKDAFQHHKMGPMTPDLLDLLEIPYEIITDDIIALDEILKKAKNYMLKNNKSFALVVRRGIFEKLEEKIGVNTKFPSREEAIEAIIKQLNGDEIIISTTGKTSRELFEQRQKNNKNFDHDFYNIGAMGCAQSIALGVALNKKKKVFVFDGDGSVLMQMGALVTIGHFCPENFYHIIFDNQAHDSTGGQPTFSNTVDFKKIALGCNYKHAETVNSINKLEENFGKFKNNRGPRMLIIKIRKGARKNLVRPPMHPRDHKIHFMKYLKEK